VISGLVTLGALYDSKTEAIRNDYNLWNTNTIEAKKKIQGNRFSNGEVFLSHGVIDRCNIIDVSAELQLSFMAGLISVEGSARYLHDEQLNTKRVSVTLAYNGVNHTEYIPADVPIDIVSACDTLSGEDPPTHVVTEVTYGLR